MHTGFAFKKYQFLFYFLFNFIWLWNFDYFVHIFTQALLSGCSAGGLASILHCDEFRGLFPNKTKVKCLSDGGMFLDA